MRRLLDKWKNVSIAKKLYFVVGIMAVLIGGELLTLRFAMRNLSAARAFVGGESLWSKAQKNAVFSLQRFGITKNEKDYEAFLKALKVNEGDHQARIEMFKDDPNMAIIRDGFIKGHIHPDDIEPIVQLMRRFHWISFLSRAIETWVKADGLLFQLKETGPSFRQAVLADDFASAQATMNRVKQINEELTVVEEDFSFVLGEGSRWLERMVLNILTAAVLTVEMVGLSLAILTTRAISRGLGELNKTAGSIGHGDFSRRIEIQSQDEIGQLGEVVNAMGEMLQKSYSELEERVKIRTRELEKMALENADLYEQSKAAVQTRDEFLSIASHELKTPLTSLHLQLQVLLRQQKTLPSLAESTRIGTMLVTSLGLAKRTNILLDELLDLTRLRIGKFELHLETCDLMEVSSDVVSQLKNDATRSGSELRVHTEGPVIGNFDVTRLGQVLTNLLSNAIKYGNGKPIDIFLGHGDGDGHVTLSVRDQGKGIPADQQLRIFERFERGRTAAHVEGLGLGLYITKKIVAAHRGSLTVQSSSLGSTFTVKIPTTAQSKAA